MIILKFIESMAKLKKVVTILSVGNLVTVSVAGRTEPDFAIPCSSCEGADVLSSALEDCYSKNLK